MTDPTVVLDAIAARVDAATDGPWEPGDVWQYAGVTGKDGTCSMCSEPGVTAPVWTGRMDINGRIMPAHKHRDPDPYGPGWLISGPTGLVAGPTGYSTGGILDGHDLDFICSARSDVPKLTAALRAVLALCAERDSPGWDRPGIAKTVWIREAITSALGDHA